MISQDDIKLLQEEHKTLQQEYTRVSNICDSLLKTVEHQMNCKTQYRKDIEALNKQLAKYRPVGQKLSKCCGEILVPFISLNKKMCSGCKTYFEWSLDHNQKPLFTDSADHSSFISEEGEISVDTYNSL